MTTIKITGASRPNIICLDALSESGVSQEGNLTISGICGNGVSLYSVINFADDSACQEAHRCLCESIEVHGYRDIIIIAEVKND